MRGFELTSSISGGILPSRGTKKSAGYDISIIEGATIAPNQKHIFKTGLKAYMQDDEYLSLHIRSSIGIKKGLILANVTGIIDSDYYNNESNEGHILIAVQNMSSCDVEIEAGERICQGIFSKYLIIDADDVNIERVGGIGSTNKKTI